ncbi:MAG: 6-carboxytetrahydropterin synthase [Bacteriovoracaceae bacterium]|jgi:6-pyruvoyltetrahydropterin/6-carboxytetrahydropterin synthase|nr:6-carboxytetrahydropterin synthase [Bacteriovoracaceae bacterium]
MDATKFRSIKNFTGFPCTHRQWSASESHCRFIHGYSRSFNFEFSCSELTKEGWVVDFGGLKEVKKWLDYMFDHTFLSNGDDPYMENFVQMEKDGIIQLRVMPNIGMEGTCSYVYETVNEIINKTTNGRAWVSMVEVRENEKNSAIYRP